MRLLVQGPNRHTKLAEELQGAVAPRDDAIVRLPYTGQDFWRILYLAPPGVCSALPYFMGLLDVL